MERTARVPAALLQRVVDKWKSEAAMTIVEIDRISARLFMSGDFLAAPPLVSSWMPVPEDVKAFKGPRDLAARDIRRVHTHCFETVLSHKAEDFDLFVDRFHVPYVTMRHGAATTPVPKWYLRRLFRQGGIHWVMKDGMKVAGDLVTLRNGTLRAVVTGVLDGDMEWTRKGGISALYWKSLGLAKSRDCTTIQLGGSRASLHDGVLRYKRKWGGIIAPYDTGVSTHYVSLFHWPLLDGAAADFLSQTSIIHHDGNGMSGLAFFPRSVPLTAANLEKECVWLHSAGLKRLRIVLPGPPPAGFVCPPDVRLFDVKHVRHLPPSVWSGVVDNESSGTIEAAPSDRLHLS